MSFFEVNFLRQRVRTGKGQKKRQAKGRFFLFENSAQKAYSLAEFQTS
jgi:hypothetical protein